MVSVCTMTSLAWSSCVLILCSLPDVSLSHYCINMLQNCRDNKEHKKNKLSKRLRLTKTKIKLTV